MLEVPADRSVNPNESFVIRRGRFVLSGDVSDRLSLYAQADFSASTGTGDFVVQARDLYGDVWLDRQKHWRVRLGQSKVPFGWVNLQSSQNRAPLERPDALNSAVEGERDLGMSLMWGSSAARQRFRDLTALGLKGSGDYGVAAVGVYSGQGLNRPDQNGDVHVLGRVSYPFKTEGGRFFELGVQGYLGHFVTTTQAITAGGETFTPTQPESGVLDQRFAVTAIAYPQPLGVEAEWNFGEGPELSEDLRSIGAKSLHGGYVQANYQARTTASAPGSRSSAGTTSTAPASSAATRRATRSTSWTSGSSSHAGPTWRSPASIPAPSAGPAPAPSRTTTPPTPIAWGSRCSGITRGWGLGTRAWYRRASHRCELSAMHKPCPEACLDSVTTARASP